MFKKCLIGLLTLILVTLGAEQLVWSGDTAPAGSKEPPITQGCLRSTDAKGEILEFPLKHTSVNTQIAGFLAQVEVKQYFKNPYKEKIEAVYTFPLPENAAVNEMVMVVGKRNIYAEIHKRAEAREMYETARAQGKRTALLEQERQNIFTQSVANINPGEEIVITIRYVQTLKYDRGIYSYVFPMVVGPRFIPADSVPDASRITPPVLKPGRRSGHDISLTVEINVGLPITNLHSTSHAVDIKDQGSGKATISIKNEDTIPNKDFILEYCAAGKSLQGSYLNHYTQQGGYVMLMLQPSLDKVTRNIKPKEIYFVVDCSGSMGGYPIAKVKEAMYTCIQGISSDDTFQIIKFSDSANGFAKAPVPATYTNKEEALDFISVLEGEGGTMMIEGIKACLDAPKTAGRQRIVFFMTDGYIGNDNDILEAVKAKAGNTKIFSFGIGSSSNRSLLEQMAQIGNGTASYIRQDQVAEPIITAMLERISKPYLDDVSIDWGGLDVKEVYPSPLPVLYSAQPLIIYGRYTNGGESNVTISGKIDGKNFQEKVRVNLPKWEPNNAALATVWAREKIKSLTLAELSGKNTQIADNITELALEYNLMSQYTSFVAIDEVLPENATSTLPKTVAIPVPMPEGVSFTGVFGSPQLYPGEYVSDLIMAEREVKYKNEGYYDKSVSGSVQSPKKGIYYSNNAPAPTSASTSQNSYSASKAYRDFDEEPSTASHLNISNKYLKNAFGDLYKNNRSLYNEIQTLYNGQPNKEEASKMLKELLDNSNDKEKAIGLSLMNTLMARMIEIDGQLKTKACGMMFNQNQAIAVPAINIALLSRQDSKLIPDLTKILLNSDNNKQYYSVITAGLALNQLATKEQNNKAKVKAIFVEALKKNYPSSAGEEKINLKESISYLALGNLQGYKDQDLYNNLLVLAQNKDTKSVRILALSILANYPAAASFLVDNTLKSDEFIKEPKLLLTVVQNVRDYSPDDNFYSSLRRLLNNSKIAGVDYIDLRTAIVEVLLEHQDKTDIKQITQLLRKDPAWKVRRAILAKLSKIDPENILPTAMAALEDPNSMIKQLALTEAVAATAAKDKRATYLAKIATNPTSVTCSEILQAEKIDPDLSLKSLKEIKVIIAKRKGS
ncbi:MAG: VIT domain-containing protein [Candidatus Margulisiibacteriota bacterium]